MSTKTHILVAAQIFPVVSFGEKIVTKRCNCYGRSYSSDLFGCGQFRSYDSFFTPENEPPKECQIGSCFTIFFTQPMNGAGELLQKKIVTENCASYGHSSNLF